MGIRLLTATDHLRMTSFSAQGAYGTRGKHDTHAKALNVNTEGAAYVTWLCVVLPVTPGDCWSSQLRQATAGDFRVHYLYDWT